MQPEPTYPPLVEATTWPEHLALLAGPDSTGQVASTKASIENNHNTRYTKSLTTPSDVPMAYEAIAALASWMSIEGWKTATVSTEAVPASWIWLMSAVRRNGLCSSSCTAEIRRRSMLSAGMKLRMSIEMRCGSYR